jgi:stage II sporulation protein D
MSQYGAYGYALHGASYQSILAHYYTGTALGQTNPNQTVRVLLSTGHASFSGATKAGTATLTPGQSYSVDALSNGRLEIRNLVGKKVGTSFSAPLTVSATGPLAVPGLGTFRGSLVFRPDGNGGVQTVNALGLDDYVKGVAPNEMPAGWSPQALEAQAVAARTYAITTSVNGNGYGLYRDTRSQMYGGVGTETTASNAAVTATRGQVVTYAGQPVVTYFFASSGGYTEDIQNVWPGSSPEPWLQGVPDPYDGAGGDPYHLWTKQMSIKTAAARLGGLVRGKLVGVQVTQHGVSPRVIRARVIGTRGTTTVSGATLQQAFGLLTTYARFTTITTNAGAGTVTGDIYPGHTGQTFTVQQQSGRTWRSLGRRRLGRGGSYRVALSGTGHYRVQLGSLTGPVVSVKTLGATQLRRAARVQLSALVALDRGHGPALPKGRLARYAWPLAGHRRPLRSVPLVLRASRLHHRR